MVWHWKTRCVTYEGFGPVANPGRKYCRNPEPKGLLTQRNTLDAMRQLGSKYMTMNQ